MNRTRTQLLTMASLLTCACLYPEVQANEATVMPEMTVTGTREGELISETPATVKVIKEQTIREMRPTHPNEVMGLIPGVWINKAGGEGHITSIRQPLTTNPVYLYLEDGVPTRSTGFFNHNALYEVNLPMAGGIEVIKGPGTALYGSDALAGVVNVLTRTPPNKKEASVSVEGGSYGWARSMLSAGDRFDQDALRADINLTHVDGWIEHSGFERQSGTLRWDRNIGDNAVLKTVASLSNIDQQSSGSSNVTKADYQSNPTRNYYPITFRQVQAFRLSSAYEREDGDSLVSVTPYLRYDNMNIMPTWQMTYDQTMYDTQNSSLGMMLKYRQDFAPMRTRLIGGLDLDYSPGMRLEKSVRTTLLPGTSGDAKVYASYREGAVIYDYDVAYTGISPYIHGEFSPVVPLRLIAGLRYDNIRYDYNNNMPAQALQVATTIGNKVYGHADSTDVAFQHLSPKLGATYTFNDQLNGFVSYNHAFRAPSEGQLFRPAATSTSQASQKAAMAALRLEPVKVDSAEVGVRGKVGPRFQYELSVYHMAKSDDILSYLDPVDGVRRSVNAGQTLHRGIEAGVGLAVTPEWRVDTGWSYAKHTYEDWVMAQTTRYSGKEMELAPRVIGNTRLTFAPAETKGAQVQVEWVQLNSYWLDPANTKKYGGHDLFNLRGSYPVYQNIALFGSITNLLDRRYAETGQVSSATGQDMYTPGMPRMAYLGLQVAW